MLNTTISHYKILEKAGEGGMGVVYKAEDLRLKRIVALKFLSASLLGGAQKERFLREAQAAASLNHPNIATIYEIEEADDKTFIAMEYIEGLSLAELISGDVGAKHSLQQPESKSADRARNASPLPLDTAINYTIQISSGLQTAHQKGITHRDIKSANIMITGDGQAKITDFGLAKVAERSMMTQEGTTLGTAAYMSPEQSAGEAVDHRTDIWSLGVVLYEMLSGQLPFKGLYESAVIYSIQHTEPEPLTAIRTGIPMSLEWIVTKLLAKAPEERYQNTKDLIIDLRAVDISKPGFSRVSRTSLPEIAQSSSSKKSKDIKKIVVQSMLMLLAIAITALITWFFRPEPEKIVRKFEFPFADGKIRYMAISPDGQKIAYRNDNRIWFRNLDQRAITEVETIPKLMGLIVWSPDSKFLAYLVDGKERILKKASIEGGDPLVIAKISKINLRAWHTDNKLILSKYEKSGQYSLFEIPAAGGVPVLMYDGDSTKAVVNGALNSLSSLPGTNNLLLTVTNSDQTTDIFVQSSENRKILYHSPPGVRIDFLVFSQTGHLLYHRLDYEDDEKADLWAVPFDQASLKITGEHFRVTEVAGYPTVANDGTLLHYAEGEDQTTEQLISLSRSGMVLDSIGSPQRRIGSPAISPDGKQVAVRGDEQGTQDIWLHDVHRNTKARLSFDIPHTWRPSWAPDGKQICYQSRVRENFLASDLYIQAVDGRSPPQVLVKTDADEYGPHWSPNGKFILYSIIKPGGDRDIWMIDMLNSDKPRPLLQSQFSEQMPYLSPDSRFMTYMSDKSGQYEIYVTPFPECDTQWQITFEGGVIPHWSGDEIFYANRSNNALMAVRVHTNPEFRAEKPVRLFLGDPVNVTFAPSSTFKFAVSRDGQQVIAVRRLGEAPVTSIVLVENWFEEFRKKD